MKLRRFVIKAAWLAPIPVLYVGGVVRNIVHGTAVLHGWGGTRVRFHPGGDIEVLPLRRMN